MAEPRKKRTWIWVVAGILISLFVIGIALLGSAIFYVRRHVHTETVTAEAASAEFERTRARFAGQTPLIELRGEHDDVVHRRTAPAHAELQTLHVLAFDTNQERLVRVSIPFWLLRMMPGRNVKFGRDQGVDFDAERMHLTVDDLESAGPGLVVDGTAPRSGTRLLVWAE